VVPEAGMARLSPQHESISGLAGLIHAGPDD
jgi:hypothetical protein